MIGYQTYVPQKKTVGNKKIKKGDPNNFRSLESIGVDKSDIFEHAVIEQNDTVKKIQKNGEIKKEKTVNYSDKCDCSQEDIELAIGGGYAVGNHVWSYNNAKSGNGLSSLKNDIRGVIKGYIKAPRRIQSPYLLIKWDGEHEIPLAQFNSYPAQNISTHYQIYIKK
jgi:hypothetical protein